MDTLLNIQQALFAQIKAKIPANLSFVHEVAELLGISYDSAYRRIRGEKDLSLEELFKLAVHFNISVDNLFNIKQQSVIFNYQPLKPGEFEIKNWLQVILKDIKGIHESKEKEIIYAAKDPPVFHYFQFPEIAAFKVFFWAKTLFQFPEYEDLLFRLDDSDPEVLSIGNQILRTSTKIPTIEIWNEDTFYILFRQIEYYWVSGYFVKKDDLYNLIEKMDLWVRHIQKQAQYGYKYMYGDSPEGIENSFMLYENEVVLNDNTIFVKIDSVPAVYLTYNVLNVLKTRDPAFCKNIETYLKGLLTESNLISLTGSKERNRFFNRLLQNIEQFKSKLDI